MRMHARCGMRDVRDAVTSTSADAYAHRHREIVVGHDASHGRSCTYAPSASSSDGMIRPRSLRSGACAAARRESELACAGARGRATRRGPPRAPPCARARPRSRRRRSARCQIPRSPSISRSSVACTRSGTYVGDTTRSSAASTGTPSASERERARDEVPVVPRPEERRGAHDERRRHAPRARALRTPPCCAPYTFERRDAIATRRTARPCVAVEDEIRREGRRSEMPRSAQARGEQLRGAVSTFAATRRRASRSASSTRT